MLQEVNSVKILKEPIAFDELKEMATSIFGNMVKAVVDVRKRIVAIDAELHSELKALLLRNGSKEDDLWGVNIYPDFKGDRFIEFDSAINACQPQNMESRGVKDAKTREQIFAIVRKNIKDSLSA